MRKYSEEEVIALTKEFFDLSNPEVFFTAGGSIAVVLTRKAGGDRPLLGAYYTGEEWLAQQWDVDGKIFSDEIRKIDLILPNTSENSAA